MLFIEKNIQELISSYHKTVSVWLIEVVIICRKSCIQGLLILSETVSIFYVSSYIL